MSPPYPQETQWQTNTTTPSEAAARTNTQTLQGGYTSPPGRLPYPATHQPPGDSRLCFALPPVAHARLRPPIPGRAAASRLRTGEKRAPRGRRPQSAPAHWLLLSDWLPPFATVQFSLSLFPPPTLFFSRGQRFYFRFPTAAPQIIGMFSQAAGRLGERSFL